MIGVVIFLTLATAVSSIEVNVEHTAVDGYVSHEHGGCVLYNWILPWGQEMYPDRFGPCVKVKCTKNGIVETMNDPNKCTVTGSQGCHPFNKPIAIQDGHCVCHSATKMSCNMKVQH